MSSIFTQIIDGKLPGRIFWRDELCVAMVDIRPLNRGHCLVVPIAEIDQWTNLPPLTITHCVKVAHTVGSAQQEIFRPTRIGLLIAGFEIPHAHLHVVPIDNMGHLDFTNADNDSDPNDLDAVAHLLRLQLRQKGHPEVV